MEHKHSLRFDNLWGGARVVLSRAVHRRGRNRKTMNMENIHRSRGLYAGLSHDTANCAAIAVQQLMQCTSASSGETNRSPHQTYQTSLATKCWCSIFTLVASASKRRNLHDGRNGIAQRPARTLSRLASGSIHPQLRGALSLVGTSDVSHSRRSPLCVQRVLSCL